MIVTVRNNPPKEQPELPSTQHVLSRKRQNSKGPRLMTSPTNRKTALKIALNKRVTSKVE